MKPEYSFRDDLSTFEALLRIVERLRGPEGCPWDLEQTHQSLKRNLLEECYEVLEAIDSSQPEKLAEEMGDLLVQLAFHTDIASKNDEFTWDNVFLQVNNKLIRRHPHVFGTSKVSDVKEVERNWDRIKKDEGSITSPVDGIPNATPALAYAQLMQDRVSRDGFDWDELSYVLDKEYEELKEMQNASTHEDLIDEIGDILFSVVNLSRWYGIHAEDALRASISKFKNRYLLMEKLSEERNLKLSNMTLKDKDRLWQEAKQVERQANR